MCSYSNEMFLRDFFIFDVAVGRFCERRAIFDSLAKIYYLDDRQSEQLFALVNSDRVNNIESLKDYKRHCRLNKYAEACKLKTDLTEAEADALAIKGKALYIVNDCKLVDNGNDTQASVYTNIVTKANAGVVTALRICGVLQCEGIFFEKRVGDGIKNLTRAARWNSIESILALLQYDKANACEYADMLYTLASNTPYENIASKAQIAHGIKTPTKIGECVLLSKVFGRGKVNCNVYMPSYANLLYSEVIPFKDKEKLLLSENKEAIALYRDLPLKLVMRKFSCDVSAITELSLSRAEEQNAIIQNALNSDIRHLHTFRPLCLCSDSQYMRGYYAAAITKLFSGAHVEQISVADLNEHDFEPTLNNIFVRSCNEDKSNVFILSFVGDIHETVVKWACDFLQSSKREKLRLVRPGVEIDLGAVLPICFCDKANASTLGRYCEKINIVNPTHDEQKTLINAWLTEKAVQYGVDGIEAEDEVISKLCSVSVDAAELALDTAITSNRNGQTRLRLTEANAGKYIKKREGSRGYGYGGCKDDN